MYTSISGHIGECSMLIWDIYIQICLLCVHEVICIHDIWGAYFHWHMYGNSTVNKSWNLLLDLHVYAVMWDLSMDYSSSAMGHACAMWKAYLIMGICQ